MNPDAAIRPASSRLLALLATGVVLLNLLAAGAALLSVQNGLQAGRERAEVATRNLADLLERDISASFDHIDLGLLAIADEMHRQSARGAVDGMEINRFIERQLARQPDVDSLRVTNARGEVVFGTGIGPAPRPNNAERDYFRAARDTAGGGLMFSRPVVGHISSKWVMILARRFDGPDGRFAGVVYAPVTLESLQKRFISLELGPGGAATLRHAADLELIARYPGPLRRDDVPSNHHVSPALKAAVLAHPDSGIFEAPTALDGIERRNAYRRLNHHPFYILVGLATTDYLRQWRRDTVTAIALTAAFCVATLLLSGLAYRGWRRRETDLAALAEQELRFRTMLDSTPDGLVIVNEAGNIVTVNRQSLAIFGYAREDLVGQAVSLLITDDDKPRFSQLLAHRLQAPPGEPGDYWARRRNGSRFAALLTISPINSGQDQLTAVLFRDITERRQTEAQLRESVAEIEDLYQHAPCGYHSLDAQGVIRRINDTELGWLGYRREEVEGCMTVTGIFSPHGMDLFRHAFPRLMREGEIHNLELELQRKDGSLMPILLSATAQRDAEGTLLLSRSTLFDMTEHARLQAERASHAQRIETLSRRILETQERERQRLANDLYDRISPNLAALRLGNLHIEKQLPTPLPDELRSALEDARALLDDTTASVQEICADLRPPLLDYLGLAAALEGYAEQFSRRTGIPVHLDNRLDQRLPEDKELTFLRIAQEALSNCARHAGAGHIAVRLSGDTRRATLEVEDDGVGFGSVHADADLPGQGLVGMRERAEFAGGSLRLTSTPGSGTRIEVCL